MPRSALALAPLLVFGLALASAPARATTLPDSTEADAWRLENGLEVRTRAIPGTHGVAVTLAFRAGSGYEPAGMEGLSELLAELEFMGAAGNVPERHREEMASLRPLGWDSRKGTRLVQLTEIATAAQLPGVLQQFAARLAGVTVTDASLAAALAQVRRDAGARLFADPGDVLYWRAGTLARGLTDEQLVRAVSMPGLQKLAARDAAARLRAWYQPGNASLSLAGDLSGVDLHALVGAAFGKLPGSAAMPDTVAVRFVAGKRVVPWKGIEAPVGVIAARAPALTDSLHAGFYLSMLITGAALTSNWHPPGPPLRARFQYSLLDEPELVRFYPPVRIDATDPDLLTGALFEQLQVVGGSIVSTSIMGTVRRNVRWLLGAELPGDVLDRFRAQPGAMGTLSSGMAVRALWMGDPFWRGYLGRFDKLALGQNFFYEQLSDQKNQALLLLTPKP